MGGRALSFGGEAELPLVTLLLLSSLLNFGKYLVVRLPGKQKMRGSSPAKGYLFLRSVDIPSR